MSNPERAELAGTLFQEINGYTPAIASGLSSLDSSTPNNQQLNELYRLFHNIKGAASQVFFIELSHTAALCEAVLANVLEKKSPLYIEWFDFLGTINNRIHDFCLLQDKSPGVEKALFSDAISFFNELMVKCGNENPITLPEYLKEHIQKSSLPLYSSPNSPEYSPRTTLDERSEVLLAIRDLLPQLADLSCILAEVKNGSYEPKLFSLLTQYTRVLTRCCQRAELQNQSRLFILFQNICNRLYSVQYTPDIHPPLFIKDLIAHLEFVLSLDPHNSERITQRLEIIFEKFYADLYVPAFAGNKDAQEMEVLDPIIEEPEELIGLGDIEDAFLNFAEPEMETVTTSSIAEHDKQETVYANVDYELQEIFISECSELLYNINIEIGFISNNLETSSSSQDYDSSIANLCRFFHTLKGASAMAGFLPISSYAKTIETFLKLFNEKQLEINNDDITLLQDCVVAISLFSEGPAEVTQDEIDQISLTITEYQENRLNSDKGSNFEEPLDKIDSIFSEQVLEFDDNILEIAEPEDIEESAGQLENNELLEIFQAEYDDHLTTINYQLILLTKNVTEDCLLNDELVKIISGMRRAVHTLKGAAAMTGFNQLSATAHSLEDLLDLLHDESDYIFTDDISIIAESIDTIEQFSQQAVKSDPIDSEAIIQAVTTHIITRKGRTFTPPESTQVVPEEPQTSTDFQKNLQSKAETTFTKAPARDEDNIDLPTDTGNIRVKLPDLDELVSIEGDLVVARGSIEKLLDKFSESLTVLNTIKDTLKRKSQELEVGFEAQSLYGFGAGTSSEDNTESTTLSEFDPIELDRYSQLNLIIRSLNELSIDVNAIYSEMTDLGTSLQGQVAKQQLSMELMQEKLLKIRMTPLSSVSRMLHRTVRQTAKQLNKDVQLSLTGEDIYMDRFVWTKTIDPLMHILRNCVDHGIENKETRSEQNKPVKGSISIDAQQSGRFVILTIGDDGKGIDTNELRTKLIDDGVISQSQDNIDDNTLLRYLFNPSVSTRDDVSEISGRGVGLDVVYRNIQELKGSVKIHNRPGEGVSFQLYIPITLSVNRAVIVQLSGGQYAVPIQDIAEVKKITTSQVQTGNKNTISWQNKDIELINLSSRLQIPDSQLLQKQKQLLTLITHTDGGHVAMLVDQIIDQREIVVKDLGSHLRHVRGINGVTLTGEGDIIPILNLNELSAKQNIDNSNIAIDVTGINSAVVSTPSNQNVPKQLKVLIVDDSISVRFSVTRLVEKQSWYAYQAVDGIDAFEQLENTTPDVIILDIEMPRMNGYEFMARLRNSPEFDHIPVIMLTSRASEKHRNKAQELGVDHYLTKPFQEEEFFEVIDSVQQPDIAQH